MAADHPIHISDWWSSRPAVVSALRQAGKHYVFLSPLFLHVFQIEVAWPQTLLCFPDRGIFFCALVSKAVQVWLSMAASSMWLLWNLPVQWFVSWYNARRNLAVAGIGADMQEANYIKNENEWTQTMYMSDLSQVTHGHNPLWYWPHILYSLFMQENIFR